MIKRAIISLLCLSILIYGPYLLADVAAMVFREVRYQTAGMKWLIGVITAFVLTVFGVIVIMWIEYMKYGGKNNNSD